MQRRQYLQGMAIGSVMLSGCAGLNPLGPSGPKGVAKRYFRALKNGNEGAIERLTHSQASRPDPGYLADVGQANFEGYSITEAEIIQEGDDRAVVRIWAEESENDRVKAEYELRTEDGEWRIWDTA